MTGRLFDPAACVRDLEAAARAGGWEVRHLSPKTGVVRPWMRRRSSLEEAPSLYISAGIHGDEIAGPLAVLELLRRPGFFDAFHTTLFPLLNPVGLERGVRENGDGLDLNRDYRALKSLEIAGHVEVLKTLGRFDGALFLHEDFEGIGAYLYELRDAMPGSLGADMIAAMGRHVPIDLRAEIEEVPARGGVIDRRDVIAKLGRMEDRLDWPEAIYLSTHHTRVAITTETPMPFPLAQRIEAQIAAVTTLMDALKRFKERA